MDKGWMEILRSVVPKALIDKLRRYVAKKWDVKISSNKKAIRDRNMEEISKSSHVPSEKVDSIVGLELESDFEWRGEELSDALKYRVNNSISGKHDPWGFTSENHGRHIHVLQTAQRTWWQFLGERLKYFT